MAQPLDELFGHVPERPHSSSQPLDQARDMPPYHRMMVRVVLILLVPGAAGAELHEHQKNSWLSAPHIPRATGQPGGRGRCPGRPRGQRQRKETLGETSWYPSTHEAAPPGCPGASTRAPRAARPLRSCTPTAASMARIRSVLLLALTLPAHAIAPVGKHLALLSEMRRAGTLA